MSYEITGDSTKGFVLEFSSRWGRVSLCPCCNKPLDTRWKAEQLGKNLQAISDGIDEQQQDGIGAN